MNLVLACMAAKLGARVAARGGIYYAGHDVEITSGSKGVVTFVTCAGALVAVKWEGRDDSLQTASDAVDFFGEDVAS